MTLYRGFHSMTTRLLRDLAAGPILILQARTSMVDGFPYKEEVGGSNPSVPTKHQFFAES